MSCLVGAPFSLIPTQIFLLKSRSTVDSILIWMDKFCQELISTGVPSKDTWPLVRSCIRFFFELWKVRAPAMKSANMTDHLDRVDSYLSAMSQAHRVTDDYTKHQWREHHALSGAINYHLFCFSVTSSQHKLLQDKVVTLKKYNKENQSEISKLVSRLIRLNSKNKSGGGGCGGRGGRC